MTERNARVVIIGAGPVGLTLALLLARGGCRPLLIDARGDEAPEHARADPRAIALAAGSTQLLERVGAWPIAGSAIREVHVAQQDGFGRTLIAARDQGLAALGHVVRYDALGAALATAAEAATIEVRYGCPALGVTGDSVGAAVRTPGGTLAADLVVHAEGAADTPFAIDYAQDAIVCEATPAQPHDGRAWERFTADGPLALLPFGDAYAVVCAVDKGTAAATLAHDDAAFLALLRARLGDEPRLEDVGPRRLFPLALRLRPRLAHGAEVWIGNAAQTLHPISGQGLNFGLRDAAELADALLESLADGEPLPAAARRFAWRRQPDRLLSLAFTDGLVRLFGIDHWPLRLARGLGLSLLDRAGPIRRRLADRLMFGTRI